MRVRAAQPTTLSRQAARFRSSLNVRTTTVTGTGGRDTWAERLNSGADSGLFEPGIERDERPGTRPAHAAVVVQKRLPDRLHRVTPKHRMGTEAVGTQMMLTKGAQLRSHPEI